MRCSDTGLCWPFCFWEKKKQRIEVKQMNVWYWGFSMDYIETWLSFCFSFNSLFLATLFLWRDKRRLWKIKTFGLYFSNQKHFHLMFFSSLNIFPFVCKLFNRKGWRQYCKSYPTPNPPSYGPMHLLSVCMNGSLSNWCTMLHYTPQWGSMQVR